MLKAAAPVAPSAWISFAKGMRDSLAAGADTIVHAVVGNEASDVDSIVSALVFAFSLSQADHPQPLRTALHDKYPDHRHVFVPLINLSPDPPEPGCRGDLQLRLDAMEILQDQLQVTPDQLVYAKGSGPLSCAGKLRVLHESGQLRLILVDHNLYTGGEDTSFGDCVEAIFDHHKDFGLHTDTVLPDFRMVQAIGSTCTLVAQSMEDAGQEELLNGNGGLLSGALASVILLDTNNLNADQSVFAAIDEVQCAARCKAAGFADPAARYAHVLGLRSCMDGFAINDMLRKDYKQWEVAPEQPGHQQEQAAQVEKEASEATRETGEGGGGGNAQERQPLPLRYGISSIISSYAKTRDDAGAAATANGGGGDATGASAATAGATRVPKANHLAAMRSFANTNGLDLLAVMYLVVEDASVNRELLFHVPTAAVAAGRLPSLARVAAEARALIDLEPQPLFADADSAAGEMEAADFVLFRQVNSRLSRKKVQPALDTALRVAQSGPGADEAE